VNSATASFSTSLNQKFMSRRNYLALDDCNWLDSHVILVLLFAVVTVATDL